MGHTPDKYLSHIVDFDITATIFSLRQAELLNELAEKAGKKVKVHIKLDTGFHRLGLDAKDRGQTLQTIRAITALPRVEAEGLFSHLALVNDEENDKQYHLFAEIADQLKTEGIHFRYYHLADSIATVDDPRFRLNMVRVGALIYGMRGFHKGFVPVEQVLTFRAAISQLHHIKEGEGVSYDYLWRAPRDSVIATLPFGYADGYPRNLRDKGYVIGGEQSGHIILLAHSTTGDGELTAGMLLRTMAEKKCRMSELNDVYVRFPQVMDNVNAMIVATAVRIP